jgi:hypothetical protein
VVLAAEELNFDKSVSGLLHEKNSVNINVKPSLSLTN